MVGLLFILGILGLWLLASSLLERDWLLGFVDLSTADLVLGEGSTRWICGVCGGLMLLICLIGVIF
jgi:hypothetical protein